MKHFIKKSFLFLILPALLLVGCSYNPLKNQTEKTTPSQQTNQEEAPTNNQNVDKNSKIDTSDWKTYENEEYGFKFEYPKDWMIVDNNSTRANSYVVGFRESNLQTSEGFSRVYILVEENLQQLPLHDFFQNKNEEWGVDYFRNNQFKNFSIQGKNAIQFFEVAGPIPNTLTAIALDKKILEIIFHNDFPEGRNIYDHMIENFSTIEQ